MATTPGKAPRRPGRPTKNEEVRRVLAEVGCDPLAIDPRRILAGIAANESMPATARVAACRTLLGRELDQESEDAADAASVNQRAIARMRAN